MSRSAVVIGTGGQARVILSILSMSKKSILGLVELNQFVPDEKIMGFPVLCSVSDIKKLYGRTDLEFYLAIGDNRLRFSWWSKMIDCGLSLPNLISPLASIDPSAKLGSSNVFCPFSFVGPEVTIGDNNLLNTSSILEHQVSLGSHCHLASKAVVAGRTKIADGCFIGAGATVINNLNLAKALTVGAGAVLTQDALKVGGVYLGLPAKLRESIE